MAGASLALESGLKFELMLTLDRLPEMRCLVAQPLRLTWLDGLVHVPDLLWVDSKGEITVWMPAPKIDRTIDFGSLSTCRSGLR